MPAVVPIIVAAVAAGGTVGAAKMASNAAKNAADTQSKATTTAATLQDQQSKDALAFAKQQAETDYRNQEIARKANFDQYGAREARISDFGQRVGLPARQTPAYVPSVDPNYTGAGPATLAGAAPGAAPASAAPSVDPQTLTAQISADYAKGHGGATIPPDVLQQQIGYASKPDLYSDHQWRVGWNPYLAYRMNVGTQGADPSMAGTAGIIPPPAGATAAPATRYQTLAAAALPYRTAALTPALQMPGTLAGLVR